MTDGYKPTAECVVIEQVHNKHHCFVPPEVWEIPAEMVCQVCRLKNLALFVSVGIEQSKPKQEGYDLVLTAKPLETAPAPVAMLVPARDIFRDKPRIAAVVTSRLCPRCGTARIIEKFWDAGERICGQCRADTRTCRFCGRENVAHKKWRAKDRMCSNQTCWEKFLQEMKFAV